jgi:hypothetical protein
LSCAQFQNKHRPDLATSLNRTVAARQPTSQNAPNKDNFFRLVENHAPTGHSPQELESAVRVVILLMREDEAVDHVRRMVGLAAASLERPRTFTLCDQAPANTFCRHAGFFSLKSHSSLGSVFSHLQK